LNQIVAWYLLTFFPALLFAISYRRISALSWIRSISLGHAFVLYGLLWAAAGIRGTWRLLTGHRGWIKTDRFDEAADSTSSLPTRKGVRELPGLAAGHWDVQTEGKLRMERSHKASTTEAGLSRPS
jgi:hypothetical protein